MVRAGKSMTRHTFLRSLIAMLMPWKAEPVATAGAWFVTEIGFTPDGRGGSFRIPDEWGPDVAEDVFQASGELRENMILLPVGTP
jgi:hypothetical protein